MLPAVVCCNFEFATETLISSCRKPHDVTGDAHRGVSQSSNTLLGTSVNVNILKHNYASR